MALNYFVCTLDQARHHQDPQREQDTVSKFLSFQGRVFAKTSALGFVYPNTASGATLKPTRCLFSFQDLYRGSWYAAKLFLDKGFPQGQTVALLCPSIPEFLFALFGLIRLGNAVLLLAPQCQPAAASHLCKTCNVTFLVYDPLYSNLAFASKDEAYSTEGHQLKCEQIPFSVRDEAFISALDTCPPQLPSLEKISSESVAILFHTSGTSSGLPKPIPQTHRGLVGVLPNLDGVGSTQFSTTPLYHGGLADCFRSWTSNALIWLLPTVNRERARIPVTANNIVSCVDMVHRRESDVSEDEYFSSVPYVLQMLAAEPDGVEALKSFACVGVGGSALSRHIGDDLVHQGVKLVSRYGSAECGFLMSSHRVYDEDSEWEYLRANSQNDGLIFEANDDNRYELIVSPSWPHLSKSNRPDGSFATSDLFVPHPTIPNAWRYDSRADSQLTLITGKKFDPAPLEADIAASPLLDDVVIFGNERPFPGALIFRSASAKAMLNTELVQAVTPEVERLNVRNQDHARIPRNMLCPIAFEDNRLKKTSKMTVIRREAYKDYDDVIKRAYKHLEKATDEHVSDRDLAKVIQSTVQTVTGRSIGLDDDLTSFGVDSIGSIQIRYALKRLLPPGSKELPFTVVEDRGTISRLAKFLIQFRQGKTSEYNDEQLLMRDLVDEYSSFAIPETSTKHYEANTPLKDSGEVVVLTGVTGALGAHIFHQLRNVLSISKIYCLVRGADNHAARSRVVKSLGSRKLPTLPEEHYASNSEHATPQIIVLPCKLHEPGLGLSDRDYNVLCSTAIVIIHAAWTVNFRLGLRSFARDQIPGLKHMLDLALGGWTYNPKGMPKFAFVSSTASVANSSGQSTSVDAGTDNARTRRFISETISRSPNTSSPLGYSRSKWVAESLCARAATAAATAVNTTGQAKDRIFILRVGQLSADIQNGIWNASEAYPLMLGSVRATGCLPDLGASEIKGENESALNWLPVDTAATAIVQALLPASSSTSDAQQLQPAPPEHGEDHARVLHITHPAPQLRWSLILQCLRDDAGERFDLLPPSQWVRELEKLEEGSHPALALLPLWKESYDSATEREGDSATKDKSGTGEPVYDTRRARESAPVLRQLFEARGNGANDDADVQSEYVGKMWRWIKENVGGATSGS